MNPAIQLLAFANLLETAHLSSLADAYGKQQELVDHCRAEGRAFLASMPIRESFHCPECGVTTAEVSLHFEDPKQKAGDAASRGRWGQPAGRYFAIDLSSLHPMLAHAQEIPEELVLLLKGARP